jgi:hypothetical protein
VTPKALAFANFVCFYAIEIVDRVGSKATADLVAICDQILHLRLKRPCG